MPRFALKVNHKVSIGEMLLSIPQKKYLPYYKHYINHSQLKTVKKVMLIQGTQIH
jgi:hypothetical protein